MENMPVSVIPKFAMRKLVTAKAQTDSRIWGRELFRTAGGIALHKRNDLEKASSKDKGSSVCNEGVGIHDVGIESTAY